MGYYSKKGMWKLIVGIIIILVSAIVLFIVTDIWASETREQVKYAMCSWSTLIKDKLAVLNIPYDLRCETVEVEFDPKKDDANDIIVEHMYKCWESTGMGKRNILSTITIKKTLACITCAEILPDKAFGLDVIESDYGQVRNAMESYDVPEEGKLFVNYFAARVKDTNYDLISNKIEITREKPLYVVYAFAKKGIVEAYINGLIGRVDQGILLMSGKQMSEICSGLK